ncbi:ice-binding family protein [Flavobacterium paronense]|uniref:Ice-binding family protein n=1 Tax=Flavobacterium paronense TaxID=1392775 RepID=A0ABV5GCN1_9FLAO|nr:ice-binding family protein [Flavobacterium paronense]MDN3676295.1 ice-binding family protein [Flavobacterium paronense]
MKKQLLLITSVALLCFASAANAQAPVLGTSSGFALFSTNGAVSSTGLSHITGNVGTNNGSSTNFGNVDGIMHDADGTTANAAASLTVAYNQLNAAIPNFFPAPLLGNGQSLNAGTYFIGQSASLNNTLTLNGQGNPNAVFIFQIQGAFSSAAGAQILLTNGAVACNVFWKIEGLVDLASNTVMKGTVVANNAAIILNSGVFLEGRALSTTGAVTVSGVTVVTPLGCGTPVLTGPAAPALNSVSCYTVFSGNGAVANTGVSFVTGDIGTNVGLTTGFQAANVTGTIHPNPDVSTAQCAFDLNTVYTYLSTLPVDIELLYPAAFGQNLVLTPHTYLMNAATVLNGTVFLNAQHNPNAVFVIRIVGALSTSTYAAVVLQNGAQAKNVFWKIDGATSLNDYTNFKGTVIGNNGAVLLNLGTQVEGRVLSTSGGIATFGINAQMTAGCTLGLNDVIKTRAQLYPNPFTASLNITLNDLDNGAAELTIYNTLGMLVMKTSLTQNETVIPMSLASGVYYYKLTGTNGTLQSGKLIARP